MYACARPSLAPCNNQASKQERTHQLLVLSPDERDLLVLEVYSVAHEPCGRLATAFGGAGRATFPLLLLGSLL